MAAICQVLVFQVTAESKSSRGTICGRTAHRAGRFIAWPTPVNMSSRYVRPTGPRLAESRARPADVTRSRRWASTIWAFRLYRSAM